METNTSTLEHQLKVASSSVFCFYLKIHNFHLNITGPDFWQYHKLLDKFYKDVFDSFDAISEQIRALDMFAPATLSRFHKLSVIQDQPLIPAPSEMIKELLVDNDKLIEQFNAVNMLASNHLGLQNFIQGRCDAHSKWGWILRSTVKSQL